jgi:hypothetical protein
MKRLRDLPTKELSELLEVPARQAHEYLEAADSIPFMQAPVHEIREGIQGLRESGKLEEGSRYFASRYKELRELLFRETEFEARYPAAYALMLEPTYPEIRDELVGLHLPSFGVRLLRHAPVVHAGRGSMFEDHYDAYSITRGKMEGQTPLADQDYEYLDVGYLQGLLLDILRREEYWERLHARRYRDPDIIERYDAPDSSPVRLTDLRLAINFDPDKLKTSLILAFQLLERPVTAEGVIRWKQQVLDLEGDLSERGFEDPDTGIVAVSFAAAALLLFVDLDMPSVEDGRSSVLDAKVWSLAKIICDLAESLDKGAGELEKLLASRAPGHQAALEKGYHDALSIYRVFGDLERVARVLGITPYNSETGKGTKSWKKKAKEKLTKAEEFEKKRYPRAAAIFANKDNEYVRRKAIQASRLSLEEMLFATDVPTPPMPRERWDWWGRKIGQKLQINTRTRRGREITKAYVDLGFSIMGDLSSST